MTGGDPRFLWLVAAVIPYGLLEYSWLRRLSAFGGPGMDGYVRRRAFSALAGALFWIAASVACAGGFSGIRLVPERVTDAVATVVIDASNSMLADDGAGQRLDRAVDFARGLAATAPAVRWRLVAFKGFAVTLCPATFDAAAFDTALNWVGPGLMDAPGSDVGLAFAEVLRLSEDSSSHLAVIFTDGNDTGDQARSMAIRLAAANVRTVLVGMGGDSPVEIKDLAGDRILDDRGEQVRLALDGRALEDWSRASRGTYVRADGVGAFAAVAAIIDEAASSIGTVRNVPKPVDGAPVFALIALAFLALAVLSSMPPNNTKPAGPALLGVRSGKGDGK